MYRVLIVDDQQFALLGLQSGLRWSDIDVTDVQVAESVEEAIECFQSGSIDLMICDIEMPGKSGLELLAWVEENSPNTVSIMLTCHADFEYAQRAIQYGAFDYLLKPVDYDQLKRNAAEALKELKRNKNQQEFALMFQSYRRKWELQLPILIERFWQDIFSQRASLNHDHLQREIDTYGMTIKPEDRVVLILLGVERWKENLTARDEGIMEYALRNLANEVILQGLNGVVIQDHLGLNLAIVYETEAGIEIGHLLERNCSVFLKECESLFQCSLSTYISHCVPISEVLTAYIDIIEREQSNINLSGQVFTPTFTLISSSLTNKQSFASQYLFAEWAAIMELGEAQELCSRVEHWLMNTRGEGWNADSLSQFVHGILFIIHTTLVKKGLSIQGSPDLKQLTDKVSYPKHLKDLKIWCMDSLQAAVIYLRAHNGVYSAVVEKVRQYVRSHLSEEILREELAGHVYLNPAYLSRLFKKETGLSLSDFIIQERINEAKKLLEETEHKITEIAGQVGYYSLGSFSSLFKRVVGITPQQYRAKKKNII